jgi:chaperone modulatory protein CbpM
MANKELIVIADYSQTSEFTLTELCAICHVTSDIMSDLVEYEIIRPRKMIADQWVFNIKELQRAQTALRLQRDLEVNLAGVALILDLLDEVETLKARAELLEKHFLRF